MSPVLLFAWQFLWFLVAWSAIAGFFVIPKLRGRELHEVLSVWVTPHLFRVLGVGLLVPNLSPGLPQSFALPTAIGDSVTAILALLSLFALQGRWRGSLVFVWVFNVIGSLDLLFALSHAVRIKASTFLTAQWYVPALVVPLMIVAHVMVFRTLLSGSGTQSQNASQKAP